jgi:hypothetical protein
VRAKGKNVLNWVYSVSVILQRFLGPQKCERTSDLETVISVSVFGSGNNNSIIPLKHDVDGIRGV